jgi:hypothetical protein
MASTSRLQHVLYWEAIQCTHCRQLRFTCTCWLHRFSKQNLAHSELSNSQCQDFLLDPYTYDYTNSTFQRKGEGPRSYEGQYVTDVLAENTFRLLDEAIQSIDQNPFFLTIAPSAPHGHIKMSGSVLDGTAAFERDTPVPAPRHAHLFADEIVPRTKNFNPNEVCYLRNCAS